MSQAPAFLEEQLMSLCTSAREARSVELGKQSVVKKGTDCTLQALRCGLIREALPKELGGCRGDVRLTGWQPFGQELLVARVQLTSQGDLRGPREDEGAALIHRDKGHNVGRCLSSSRPVRSRRGNFHRAEIKAPKSDRQCEGFLSHFREGSRETEAGGCRVENARIKLLGVRSLSGVVLAK